MDHQRKAIRKKVVTKCVKFIRHCKTLEIEGGTPPNVWTRTRKADINSYWCWLLCSTRSDHIPSEGLEVGMFVHMSHDASSPSWNGLLFEYGFFLLDLTLLWPNKSPPPHFGGAWESLVKSAKRMLTTILHNQTLTDEILVTTLITIENLLNRRPLAYLSDDPVAPQVLTPNHFLVGRVNPHIQRDIYDTHDLTSKKRWRISQTLVNNFWNRWMREYLPLIQERKKCCEETMNLNVGDMVIVMEPKSPRGHLCLGKILKTIAGNDGTVRSAIIKNETSGIHPPAAEIYPLGIE